MSERGLFWVGGGEWKLTLGWWGWVRVFRALFWMNGGGWDIILGSWGWVGISEGEWRWVYCLIMSIPYRI